MERRDEQDRESEEKAHKSQVEYLKETIQELKDELERILSTPKKWSLLIKDLISYGCQVCV